MNWKNLVVTAFLGTSMAFMGCGDDDVTPTDTGADTNMADGNGQDTNSGGDLSADCADGACTFLVSVLTVDDGSAGQPVAGFNLDGEVSTQGGDTGCGKADFTNKFDPSEEGVDNQLAAIRRTADGLLTAPLNDTLAASIADGSLLIVMDLSGIDGATDSEVMGQVVIATLPAGATLEVDGGVPVAGQTFVQGGSAPLAFTGTLSGGVLTATLSSLTLPISEGVEVALQNVNVRMSLTNEAVADAEIGGAVAVADLTAALPDNIPAMVVEGFADTNMAGTCDGISAGVDFDAVSATLN